MANIREYTAPVGKLNPDEKSYQAWEMAGRRIGPLFSQQAASIKEGGRINSQVIAEAGKGQDALIKQAQQLNTDALDYMGILKQQRASGGAGVAGGGARPSSSGGAQPFVDPNQYARAASNLASAANQTLTKAEADAKLADYRARQFPTIGPEDPGSMGGGPNGSVRTESTHTDSFGNQDWSYSQSGNQNPNTETIGPANPAAGPGGQPWYDANIRGVQPAAAAAAAQPGFLQSGWDTVVNAASSAYNWATENASQTQAAEAVTPDSADPTYGQ